MTIVEHERGDATIREATRADLLDVLRIEKSVFQQPWPYSAFERYVEVPGFLVSENDGYGVDTAVTGYVVAHAVPNHGRPLGHVKDIAVHSDCRGAGIGKALLGRSLAVLRREGARSVKLEVRRGNDPAIALYRQFGFEYLRTLPRYYSDGEDALVFVANLADRDAF